MTLQSKLIYAKQNIFNVFYFCFFLLLPFIYSSELIDPVLIPRQIYLTIFVFLISTIILYQVYLKKIQSDFSFLKLSLPFIFLVLIIATAISYFQSIAITESIYVLSKIIIVFIFFINTTYLLIQQKLHINYILKSIIVFGIIIVIFTIYQLLILFYSENNFAGNIQMIKSTFANKNLLSSILFLTFPFIVNSIVLSKPWKIASISSILLITILIWLIQTKAVIIAFLIFYFIFLFLTLKYQREIVKNTFIKIFLISVPLLILFASNFTIQNKQEFPHLSNINSAFSRLLMWENSGEMIKENFVFGVGAGNWQVYFPKYGFDKFSVNEIKNGLTTYQRPHNDFLWILCETGIIGILAFVSIFIIISFYLFKLIKKSEKWEDNCLYFSFFATIIGYLVISFVDFPLERIEHQILLYLIFSIITAKYYDNYITHKISKKTIIKLPLLLILLILPVLYSFIVSLNRYSGEYHTHKLYNAHHQSNWNLMIKEADKAINSCYVLDPMSTPIEWYKGVALFSSGNIDKAKLRFEKAYAIHPYNIHVLNNLASCYESSGDHKKAEETYLKALSISSSFEEARLNLSAVYYNMKEFEKAFEMIDKCDINSIDPKYQTFLPVILKSYIDVLSNKQKDRRIIENLAEEKKSKDNIVKLYLEIKKNNTSFKEYILNN